MQSIQKHRRAVLLFGVLSVTALALLADAGRPGPAHAQTKAGKKRGKFEIPPPPEDGNELSMEVTALRMLYLLKAGQLQLNRIRKPALLAPTKTPRKRQPAEISANYRKVLLDLRAAFIAEQEDRIDELSEQLEELNKEDDAELDDEVEVTQFARERAGNLLNYFDAVTVVSYLAAYGKDFPDLRGLMYQAMRLDGKSKKQPKEEWEKTRAFVIREMSWMIGGIDQEKAKPQKIGERVAALLDEAYKLSDEDLKVYKTREGLKFQVNRLVFLPPTDIIKHVIAQDLAELLSNPRLRPAIDVRLKYLAWQGKKLAAE